MTQILKKEFKNNGFSIRKKLTIKKVHLFVLC